MEGKKTYLIELASADPKIDPYLRVDPLFGKSIDNDDIDLPSKDDKDLRPNLDSRVILRVDESLQGLWWVLATTSPIPGVKDPSRTGDLQLRISEVKTITDYAIAVEELIALRKTVEKKESNNKVSCTLLVDEKS
jgi:hypothetical protein